MTDFTQLTYLEKMQRYYSCRLGVWEPFEIDLCPGYVMIAAPDPSLGLPPSIRLVVDACAPTSFVGDYPLKPGRLVLADENEGLGGEDGYLFTCSEHEIVPATAIRAFVRFPAGRSRVERRRVEIHDERGFHD